jgi:tetratricopeptide (TPR) repeat protein
LIYEESEQLTNAHALLLPFKTMLGASEGARILGQALVRENQNEDAYQLLYPYVQTRLQRLRAIERTYTNAVASASARAIGDLEHNRAGEAFYSRYRSASKDEQRSMVNTYIRDAMTRDGTYKRALAELQASSKIVHVTLDLGIVQLNRAQALQEAAARRAELEAAEKTFLAIGGLAGDSDEYKMFLGQVYYWLGKSAQGKELFDRLLADRKRGFHVLVTLAEILRKVGDRDEARALFEEAHRKAPREEQRHYAAAARAHVELNTDDQIAWLKKADPKDALTQIGLATAIGRKALADGDNANATIQLRKAIAGYESMPRDSAAAYNNCGLAYLDLYRATGDVNDHEKGVRLLEGAVDFDPSNSILLKNTLRMLYHAAINDVLRGKLNLESIGESGDLSALAFLYKNEPERDAVFHALFENPKMKKALAYLDKALLLSPKEGHLYQLGAHLHGSLRNVPELQRLKQRLAAAQLDPSHAMVESAEFLSGARDKEYFAQLNGSIARLEAALLKPAVQRDTRLQDYIHCQLANLNHGRAMYGARIDSATDLDRARVAYERTPCSATRSTYAFTLAHRAHEQLIASDENYARAAKKMQRAASAPYLLSLMLDRDSAIAATLRTNVYFIKAADLYREGAENFPHHSSGFEWAFLKPIYPQTADAIAQHLAKDEGERLATELELSVRPLDATANLERYWSSKSAGDLAAADAAYQKAIKAGLPLPEL